MNNLYCLIAKYVFKCRIVWLVDFQGKAYKSIRRTNTVHDWCYVYPLKCIGYVVLDSDGGCSGPSSYIDSWSLEK